MSDELKRRWQASIGWTALALLVLYLLSYGPACLLEQRASGRSVRHAFDAIYAPIAWARQHSPAVDGAASWCAVLWIGWAPLAAAFLHAFSVETSVASQTSALPREPVPLRAGSDSDQGDAAHSKVNNEMAFAGFILALLSFFGLWIIGITPVLGIVFSYIGLHTFDPVTQKNKWQVGVGLVINLLAMAVFLIHFTDTMNHAWISPDF
jgi:hypothetical protein